MFCTEDARNQLFKIRTSDSSDAQNGVMNVFKTIAKLRREYGSLDESKHCRWSDLLFLDLLERLLFQLSSADMLDIPLLPRCQLLGECQQLILGNVDIFDKDSTICRLSRMGQNPPHYLPCSRQAAYAYELIAAVIYLCLSVLEVDEHPASQAPVEERSIEDQRVAC